MSKCCHIAVMTGTRADYGLLYPVLKLLRDHPGFELHVVATCMHLSPLHGMTVAEIERDGFCISERVEMLMASDRPTGIAQSMGLGMMGFAQAFERLKPDAVMLLGDRFEMLAAASAAAVMGIPLLHLEGGHITEGAIDDAMRHAITKLAHLHFTAATPYAKRLIQMGEDPERVHVVGSTGLDNILSLPAMTRKALGDSIGFDLGEQLFLVTFHPATLGQDCTAVEQAHEMLMALRRFEQAHILITQPNADSGGHEILTALQAYVSENPARRKLVTSLGRVKYISALSHAAVVIGNSSSGLIEAPSFHIGTVNIGTRQQGRLRGETVLDCPVDAGAIESTIHQALSPAFLSFAAKTENPFGDGSAAQKIIAILAETEFSSLIHKRFHNLA